MGKYPTSAKDFCWNKPNGELTCVPDEERAAWFNHFSGVLNITSPYRQEVIDEMTSHPPVLELDNPPTFEELENAMSKMKQGKAGGKTGILPEL